MGVRMSEIAFADIGQKSLFAKSINAEQPFISRLLVRFWAK
jgi:hypothetical protein